MTRSLRSVVPPGLHVILVIAAVGVDAALVVVGRDDNAVGSQVLLVVIAPEGVADGYAEVVAASALEAVLGLNLRLLLVVCLGNLLGVEVPIVVVVPVDSLYSCVPDTEIVVLEVFPVEVPILNGRGGSD